MRAAPTIRWIETFTHTLQLHRTPLSVAEVFDRERGGIAARLDLHVGDAGGEERLQPLHVAARPVGGRRAELAEPLRLRTPGPAVPARRFAGPAESGLHRVGRRRRLAGDPGRWRPDVRAVHDAAGRPRGRRPATRADRGRRRRIPVVPAGRRRPQRTARHGAGAPATASWSAARASGKGSTSAVGRCRWSSSTSCRSRRPTIRCWPRDSRRWRAGRQSVHGPSVAERGDQPEAGGGPRPGTRPIVAC